LKNEKRNQPGQHMWGVHPMDAEMKLTYKNNPRSPALIKTQGDINTTTAKQQENINEKNQTNDNHCGGGTCGICGPRRRSIAL
jgi:hypothetical protein